MTIEDIKNEILAQSISPGILIFVNSENSFIANQYIRAIAKIKQLSIENIDSLDAFKKPSKDIFGMSKTDKLLYVCRMDEFDFLSVSLSYVDKNNLILVVKKALTDGSPYEARTVRVPKLESWQIKDYMYSRVEGVERKQLDWLQELCGNNIERIKEELDKITLFSKSEQQRMFTMFVKDKVFGDLSLYNIFNFSNAILDHNIPELTRIWAELKNIDVEPLGLVTVLCNNIRNIIKIQLSNRPTAESVGMSPKQFYAVSHNCNKYTKDQLISMFLMLTDIDRGLKSGTMPAELILDYIVLNILKWK